MHWDHVIRGGTIVNSNGIYEGNIYIKNGTIQAITKESLAGTFDEETIAKGCYVLPGLIDVHIHSRDPGFTYKEDFFHSTQAAAAGGITTVFEMPNSIPVTSNVRDFHKQVNNFEKKAHVDFGLWGVCLGNRNLNDIKGLSDAGVIGFKYFWGYARDKETYQTIHNYKSEMKNIIPPPDDGESYEIFREVAKTGKILAVHSENLDLIKHFTDQVRQSELKDYEALLNSRPNLAEETTIQTGISFAKKVGTRYHIAHLTTREGVKLIRQAQMEGYPITTETCPQYLFLSNEDYNLLGSIMKVNPPIRYKEDQEQLWLGIDEGVISLVCSDHAPHTEEEKDGDLFSIPGGMCGVETLAPLMINAVSEGRISIQKLVSLLSENPAKLFDIYPNKGSLQVGTDADITIIDMNKKYTIKKDNLHSISKVTPYDGLEIKGAPVQTIVRGETVMKDGYVIGEPRGKLINPNTIKYMNDSLRS